MRNLNIGAFGRKTIVQLKLRHNSDISHLSFLLRLFQGLKRHFLRFIGRLSRLGLARFRLLKDGFDASLRQDSIVVSILLIV